MLSKLWSLFMLARAPFLAGGVVMYALGVVVAYADGVSLDLWRIIWGQVGLSAIQLMTHFINEYYDAGRDALVTARTPFSGGSGVLPAGRLRKHVTVVGAIVSALVGIVVAITVGWPVMLIYVIGLLIGYGYSAPPPQLMNRGLGELAAALTIALFTPLAGYGVATGRLDANVIWLGLPLLPTNLAFMITVELPDYEVDRSTGKRTWVVRWGRDRAGRLHNALLILSYSLLALVGATDHLPAQVAALLWCTLPLAVWQLGGVWLRIHRGWHHYGMLAGGGMVLVGLYGVLAGLGFGL